MLYLHLFEKKCLEISILICSPVSCTQPTSYTSHPLVPLGPRVLSVCRQYSVEKNPLPNAKFNCFYSLHAAGFARFSVGESD